MANASNERVLVAQVTASCNLRCAYCYQADKPQAELPWPHLRAALEWVVSARGRARVAFTGGEPLLVFPLIRRAVDFVERERPAGLEVRQAIMTNGLALDDGVVAFCADHEVDVELSFDGVRAAQDLRGRGTFAVLDRLLSRLRVARPDFYSRRLHVCVTLCRSNLRWLADSVKYFLDAGVRDLSISPAMTPDAAWTPEDEAELDRQFARVHADSLDHYARTGVVPLEVFRKTSPHAPAPPRGDTLCHICSRRTRVVDATGRVVPCLLFAMGYHQPGHPLIDAVTEVAHLGLAGERGTIRRLDTCRARLRAMPLFGMRHAKYSSWGRCAECGYADRCFVCPVSVGLAAGNADPHRVPDYQCAFTRTSLAWQDRFPQQSPIADAFRRLDRLLASVHGSSSAGEVGAR